MSAECPNCGADIPEREIELPCAECGALPPDSKQFIDNEPFSYVNETLEEDIKLTELESPNDIRFRLLVGSPLKLERQLYWPT